MRIRHATCSANMFVSRVLQPMISLKDTALVYARVTTLKAMSRSAVRKLFDKIRAVVCSLLEINYILEA